MPEDFMKDTNVPARWRVLGVLNGFFINGKKCWASNEWIGKIIGSHKDTVSQAIKELEDLGKIRCERTRRTRFISQVLCSNVGDNAYLGGRSTPISDRRQRLTNADSNADREKGVAKATPLSFKVVPDEPQKVRPLRDKEAFKLRGVLYGMFEEEFGVPPTPHMGDYTRVVAALKRLKPKEVIEMICDALDTGKKRTVREILTDRAIDIYLQDNA